MKRIRRLDVKWFRKAAELGHAGAMSDLGYCYYHGFGVEYDPKMAFQWYMRAADNGHPDAKKLVEKYEKKAKNKPHF